MEVTTPGQGQVETILNIPRPRPRARDNPDFLSRGARSERSSISPARRKSRPIIFDGEAWSLSDQAPPRSV
ncbi:MAG: hypothetical protein LBT86_05675 [Deltaproteobacteria bacterium]|nr:hypothetical protein [Deltaproteobacteria bacterium]